MAKGAQYHYTFIAAISEIIGHLSPDFGSTLGPKYGLWAGVVVIRGLSMTVIRARQENHWTTATCKVCGAKRGVLPLVELPPWVSMAAPPSWVSDTQRAQLLDSTGASASVID